MNPGLSSPIRAHRDRRFYVTFHERPSPSLDNGRFFSSFLGLIFGRRSRLSWLGGSLRRKRRPGLSGFPSLSFFPFRSISSLPSPS